MCACIRMSVCVSVCMYVCEYVHECMCDCVHMYKCVSVCGGGGARLGSFPGTGRLGVRNSSVK